MGEQSTGEFASPRFVWHASSGRATILPRLGVELGLANPNPNPNPNPNANPNPNPSEGEHE